MNLMIQKFNTSIILPQFLKKNDDLDNYDGINDIFLIYPSLNKEDFI